MPQLEPYFSMYYPDTVDLPDNPPGHLDSLPPAAARLQRFTGTGGPYTGDQLLRARAAYYGMITCLDELQDDGLLETAGGSFVLTPRGRLLGNEVFSRFF